jgi:NAD(P)-dependent dehydrogenase (short-subunit alcohol dehydrogenase family)
MNEPQIQRPVVLITGGAWGIGHAAATLLTQHNYRVFVTSRRPEPDTDRLFEMLLLEVKSDQSAAACIKAVYQKAGRIDALINNVGTGIAGAVEETALAEARQVVEVNFWGSVRMINEVLPIMRAQRSGRIINLSSTGGFIGFPFRAFYAASKFALEGYTESLRYEVKPLGIHVSLVEPGPVTTPAADHVPNATGAIPAYADTRQRLNAEFNRMMQNGMAPTRVAETIFHILESSSPRLRYRVGAQTAAIGWMRSLLPQTVFESVFSRFLGMEN